MDIMKHTEKCIFLFNFEDEQRDTLNRFISITKIQVLWK